MKFLKDILYKVDIEAIGGGSTSLQIRTISSNSKQIQKGDVFVALKGASLDGHEYIQDAIQNGAVAIVYEIPLEIIKEQVLFVQVKDSHEAFSRMAANFYDHPSHELKLVGVTGTNGKTTIATLLYKLFKRMDYKVGLLSTLNIMVEDKEYPSTHTTPDAMMINKYLKEMVSAGVSHCFMEVSSHGVHQRRVSSLEFTGGIFTNLTHDHLDYHKTFAEYRDAKKMFFDCLPSNAFAIINADDKNGKVMVQNTKALVITYATRSDAHYKAKILENNFSGLYIRISSHELHTSYELYSRLVGKFNAYNILAVYLTAIQMGEDAIEVLRNISLLESVSGRFQYFFSNEKKMAIVDYAHTPDALRNVLETINELRTKNEQLITVIGCGGNRDKSKRPLMAAIATEFSDKVILTSDNPRTESPEAILEDMEKGVPPLFYKKVMRITDRLQAIKTACQIAQDNDIILVAGKGHENYQEINGERIYFNDYEHLKNILID